MAVDYADPGGEYYFSLGITAPGEWGGTTGVPAPILVNNAPAGAATTYGIAVVGSDTMFRNLASNFVTFIMSGRYYVGGSFLTSGILMQVMDGATTQVELRVDALGHLFATRNGTQIGSASSQQIVANSGWHYFELQVTINSTTGTVSAFVDNVQWLTVVGANTQNTGAAQINRVQYANFCSSGTSYWKDMVGIDTAGGVNVARLGDVTVGVLFPNAAGVNQAWTNNGGASQTASVQDGIAHSGSWPDGDATYISSSTAAQISDFAHQALTLTGNILAVVHKSYMRKDDSGSRTVAQVCLSGGTTEVGATISLGNTYQYFTDIIENDPNTAAPWTVTNLNNATFGVKELT